MSTAASSTTTSSDGVGAHRRQPWRENVEALIVAISVALLFKYFILEISKIPSGSMQPTLMGSPQTQVFDRVLVDKLSMRMRDPERFEIIVFKHPIEHSRIMVKRLVGMPGEELRVFNGDLWTRPLSSDGETASEWKLLRRPEVIQESAWRSIDRLDPKLSSWKQVLGDSSWRFHGRDVQASGPGRMRFRADSDSIRDGYTDGYPDALRDSIQPQDPRMLRGISDVGDLRVSADLTAAPELEAAVVLLTEDVFAYEFTLPGPAATPDARPSIEVRERGKVVTTLVAEAPFALDAGRSVHFAAWNLDDRLGFQIGEQEALSVDVSAVSSQRSSVFLELKGGGGSLEDLQVERDIYYLAPNGRSWTVEIPEGHYVVLGDNTQDSADSRDWRAQTWTLRDADGSTFEVTGNFRDRGENPTRVKGPDGRRLTRFRDRYGEIYWFPSDQGEAHLPYHSPLVPRELIQGRAVATFWPLKPWKKIWRLGWLH